MELIRKIGVFALVILAGIGLVIDVGYLFYFIFDTTSTSGTNYIGEQTPSDVEITKPSEEDLLNKKWFIEANYFSNENKNGIELQEVKFQSFTDYSMSSGSRDSVTMQHIGNYNYKQQVYSKEEEYEQAIKNDFYYYSTFQDLSANWKGLQTQLNRSHEPIVKIENEAYKIQLNGTKSYTETVYTGYTNGLSWWNPFGVKVERKIYYTYANVFSNIMHGLKTNSIGEGTFLAKLDLSKYFTSIEKFNTATQKWEEQDADIVKNYSVIKFNYSKNGAVSSSQSMAKIIADNPKYDTTDKEHDTSYWQERVKYTLTAKDLSYRYSSTLGGHVASLSLSMKNDFSKMSKADVSIELDLNDNYLTSKNIKLVGLDYNAFENFRLTKLKLWGSGDFTFYDKSLHNSSLQILERSNEINVIKVADAINSAYKEVII